MMDRCKVARVTSERVQMKQIIAVNYERTDDNCIIVVLKSQGAQE